MKIYLAPMEGVVDGVIRDLFTRIGGYDQCVTEFIRVTNQLLPERVFRKYTPELATGGRTQAGVPVFVQLLGSDPQALAENAAFVVSLGAPGIDLNFGCPAKTVNRHDGGASLLKDPERVFRVTAAVRRAVPEGVPVTTKVRLGFDHKEFCADIARAAAAGGSSRLTIHARTKTDGYRPPAYWEYIPRMREAAPDLPMVANGEIWSVEDYVRCRELSGCEDVAIGRPAFAAPDLALRLKAAARGETHEPLTWTQLRDKWFPRFVRDSLDYRDEPYAVARSKQWAKHLGRTFAPATAFFDSIKTQKTAASILSLLESAPGL